jgi:hypothetical protein
VKRYANNARQIYSIQNWRYLGSMSDDAQACQLHAMAAVFDAAGDNIQCLSILSSRAKIVLR